MANLLLQRQTAEGAGYLRVHDESLGEFRWDRKPLGPVRCLLLPQKHRRRSRAIALCVDGALAGWIPDTTADRIFDLLVELIDLGHSVEADVWNRPGTDRTLMVGFPSRIEYQMSEALKHFRHEFPRKV